jgi:ankyrin repeat domain-containing protein 50
MVVNHSSYVERLSNTLMAVGRSAPRYQTMALVYPESKVLQTAMMEYCLVVVRLCHELLTYAKKSAIGQFASALTDADLKQYQLKLEQWGNDIQEEVNTLLAVTIENEARNNAKLRLQSDKSVELAKTQLARKAKLSTLDACSTYDHQTSWKQIRKLGSSTILTSTAEYKKWKYQTKSSTLVCTGKLGSGKSVLLANIIDDILLDDQVRSNTLVSFFCRYNNIESLKARTIVGSLARQLLCQLPDHKFHGAVSVEVGAVLDLDEIVTLLQLALPSSFRAYIILDGLDECDNSEKDIVISQLRTIQEKIEILVCISFRDEPNTDFLLDSSSLYELSNTITISMPEENPDIESFLDSSLKQYIKSKKLMLGDPTLILEIRDSILQRAQGMFLWVDLLLKSLLCMPTDEAIRDCLADLPTSLSETFTRVLMKANSVENSYRKRIFDLIIVAQRPLSVEELREALSVNPGDANWKPSKLLNDVRLTLASCGPLVTIDEEDSTVQLIHQSVEQFLLQPLPRSLNLYVSLDKGNRLMADIIITYLSYSVFEAQLSTQIIPQISAKSAPAQIVSSLGSHTRIGNTTLESVRNVALRLLDCRQHEFDFDIRKTLAEARKSLKSQPQHLSAFHQYAKSYWLNHILHYSEYQTSINDLLRQLLMKGDVISINTTNEDGQDLLSLVVKTRRSALMRLITSTQSCSSTEEGIFPELLHMAIEKNQVEIVGHLLSAHYEDVTCTTVNKLSPFFITGKTRFGRTITVLLRDSGNYDIVYRGPNGEPAFFCPIQMSHYDLAIVLANHSAVEWINDFDMTELTWATGQYNEAEMRLLIESHPDLVDSKDKNQNAPLEIAIAKGHKTISKLLLSHGANPEREANHEKSAICVAIQRNQPDLLVLLLGYCSDNLSPQTVASALQVTGATSDCESLTVLLMSDKVNIETAIESGHTLLTWAAMKGYAGAVRILLTSRNVHPDSRSAGGRASLSLAIENGHDSVVSALLAHKCNVNVRDTKWSQTPLILAATRRDAATVRSLLQAHAEVDARDSKGRTALSYAAGNGVVSVVRILMDSSADVNACDFEGKTVLSRAAYKGNFLIVKWLMKCGAVPDSRDENGRTPLSYAAQYGFNRIAELLVQSEKVDVDSVDNDGRSILWWANTNKRLNILRLLEPRGAL